MCATAISLCVASRQPRAAWRHAHAHDLARAQAACAAGILGARSRADSPAVKQELEKTLVLNGAK
jgi:hypothetical protein